MVQSDLRRTVALFDVVAVLTTSLARSICWSILKDGSAEDGGDDFRSVCVGTCCEFAGLSMLLAVDEQLVEAFDFR
jgi:hypothetical protein